ncbi:MAG: hypothetical protein WD342_20290 [Verrucomicrobiales bacterium]
MNGLLVTLTSDRRRAEAVRALISSRSGVALGPLRDRWQPLAVDTPDVKSAHDFHEWLEALPGVEQVDVIYVGFDQPDPTDTAP